MENQSSDTESIKETAKFRPAAETQENQDFKEKTNSIEFLVLMQEIITDAYCVTFVKSFLFIIVVSFVNYVYSH